ncbi:HEAT repeat domain-containing protein [Methanocorpusculum vombati]|uniref:HEAT repeat domain-containing protein n=1 Tax=Methanocorpusculum vombati TaxID=3002864 RepID=A0ABT4IN54_9EURY|nr:HEAT repeat domain-containing protein [Methanocorpusculum vombati]MCZ9319822.1 HEAT repeat domain-containing protein [Methanocorpusculum sp.]MCZ0863186.1 HEAT repeat domain-containing protein [Methanocorpusculum vombati]MDE2520369.1 HEAT repeat domain-containing protein [Methanocorpusculum sp.]MDE2534374.1 HEAT repeat domain-containing protein [Methanocorpusculum sp.]MDE2546171.1 HEAT repeat domain-containing protein [Methanocorpusculum sp.]
MSDAEKSSADLVRLLYAEDKAVRNAAAKELGSRGMEGFAAAVPLLADVSWVVRYRACEIIGMTRQPEAFPVLLRMLSDPRDHVRYMAVKGLGILGDSRALPDVIRMQEDENPFVRRIAGKIAADLS